MNQSPSSSATGCNCSTCSDTTLTMTMMGMLSSIPQTPHKTSTTRSQYERLSRIRQEQEVGQHRQRDAGSPAVGALAHRQHTFRPVPCTSRQMVTRGRPRSGDDLRTDTASPSFISREGAAHVQHRLHRRPHRHRRRCLVVFRVALKRCRAPRMGYARGVALSMPTRGTASTGQPRYTVLRDRPRVVSIARKRFR